MLRTSLLRQLPTASARTPRVIAGSFSPLTTRRQGAQHQTRQAHAISNPTLADIEKRWEGMPPQEQADLWMALRDRMKSDWHDLTLQEKKAAYWIAFGPHGPRAGTPPGENFRVFQWTVVGLLISGAIFYSIHHFARPAPHTMTKEWQEATNEYMKENKIEPITGPGGEDYKGPGMVQSPSEKYVKHQNPE